MLLRPKAEYASCISVLEHEPPDQDQIQLTVQQFALAMVVVYALTNTRDFASFSQTGEGLKDVSLTKFSHKTVLAKAQPLPRPYTSEITLISIPYDIS
jgi:hypothetical protein